MEFNRKFWHISLWFSWLKANKYFWLFVLAAIVAILSVDWVGCQIGGSRLTRLPISGWLLEVLGVSTLVIGLNKKLKFFGKVGLWGHVVAFFREIPLFRYNSNQNESISSSIQFGFDAKDIPSFTPNAEASLNERVDSLEIEIQRINAASFSQAQSLKKTLDELRQEYTEKINLTDRKLNELKRSNIDLQTEGFGLELFGICCVLFGLSLATIPNGFWWLFNDALSLVSWAEFAPFGCPHP